jgi:sortase A
VSGACPKEDRTYREELLLKVGVAMMAVALTFTFVGVVITLVLRDKPERALASEVAVKSSVVEPLEPLVRGDPPGKAWVEKPKPQPRPDAQEIIRPQPKPQPKPKPKPQPDLQSPPKPVAKPKPQQSPLPATEHIDRPTPTKSEVATSTKPRNYELAPGAIMALTINVLGVHNVPVFDSDAHWALNNGVAHEPQTSLPWTSAPQRNVYLAGHRLGWPGTASYHVFYDLDKLAKGDEILLRDRQSRAYRYRVSEVFVTNPTDTWVMGQVRGRDMVTLQTCTPIPTFEKRLIVRADRI